LKGERNDEMTSTGKKKTG